MPTLPAAIFCLLRSRGFRLALLLIQFAWLNAIVPGHRRGIVRLPGAPCPQCDAAAAPRERACCAPGAKKSRPAPSDPAAHCAICFFSARLSPAVAFDFTHPPLELRGTVDQLTALIPHAPAFAATYLGRAPPANA